MRNDLLIIGTGVSVGGVPEDIQKGIIQIATTLVVWLLTKLFDRKKK
jgi:hypothetical protein